MNEALYYKGIRCTLYGARAEAVQVFPRLDDLSIDYEREQGYIFYRKKLSGNVTFVGNDYDVVASASLETEMTLKIERILPTGRTIELSRSTFYPTDCEFDEDKKIVTVSPTEIDNYQSVIDSLDREYSIQDLLPQMTDLTIYKRPLIQIYVIGDDVLQNYTAGNSFEQDCGLLDSNELEQFHFYDNGLLVSMRIVIGREPQGSSPDTSGIYVGGGKVGNNFRLDCISGKSYYVMFFPLTNGQVQVAIYNSAGVELFYGEGTDESPSIICNAVAGSGATGSMQVYFKFYRYYARMMHNDGTRGYPIAADDVAPNPNYTRVSTIDVSSNVVWSARTSAGPTPYGKTAAGNYYTHPYNSSVQYYPISITQWPDKTLYGYYLSIWMAYDLVISTLDRQYRKAQVVGVAYKLVDVVKMLIVKNALGITFDDTSDYSQLLFSSGTYNVMGGRNITLFLIAKSNIINGDYRKVYPEPTVSLGQILDMLQKTMQVYWYLDGNKLRLEHRRYFDKGLKYTGDKDVGYDLTSLICPRNGKTWSYGRNQYKYDKGDMPKRYQFKWMDSVTKAFAGYPISVSSSAVSQGQIEEVTIENFSSDIDYMLTNPGGVSEDGFAVIGAIQSGSNYLTPIVSQTTDGVQYSIQNGIMAYIYMHPIYWLDDMPAKNLMINNASATAYSVRRTKRQTIDFPSDDYAVDEYSLIKTGLGEGQIDKLSVSLISGFINAEILQENDS
mgnify:CR=1 FL=1